jgi:cobalt/nickel transport system permease protein
MADIARSFYDLHYIDTLSCQDSPVHRIDPRAKLVTFLVFVACVVSFGKYEVSALVPYFLFIAVIIPLARIPARFLMRKILFLLPIAVLMGAFNPFYDRHALFYLGTLPVSGGLVSFFSILIRFILTVLAALILIAVTGFNGICMALERFHVPKAFSVQLMMLYRYLFVLTSEGVRMARARDLRAVGGQGLGIKVYGSLLGHLLLRTWHRAQRIHMAMLSRGFTGEFHLRRSFRIGPADIIFVVIWCSFFIGLRLVNLPQVIGKVLVGGVT